MASLSSIKEASSTVERQSQKQKTDVTTYKYHQKTKSKKYPSLSSPLANRTSSTSCSDEESDSFDSFDSFPASPQSRQSMPLPRISFASHKKPSYSSPPPSYNPLPSLSENIPSKRQSTPDLKSPTSNSVPSSPSSTSSRQRIPLSPSPPRTSFSSATLSSSAPSSPSMRSDPFAPQQRSSLPQKEELLLIRGEDLLERRNKPRLPATTPLYLSSKKGYGHKKSNSTNMMAEPNYNKHGSRNSLPTPARRRKSSEFYSLTKPSQQ
eukprot:Awhi_evm1s950